jgi:hypothetical protein
MRKCTLAICLISVFVFGAREAYAFQCDCVGRPLEKDYRGSKHPTAHDEFKNSEAVFIGEVVDKKKVQTDLVYRGSGDYEYEISLKVKSAWKKNLGELVAIRETGSCLIGFEKGEEYLVYASIHNNRLLTLYCSRTRRLAKAIRDLKEFEENGEKPITKIGTIPPKL